MISFSLDINLIRDKLDQRRKAQGMHNLRVNSPYLHRTSAKFFQTGKAIRSARIAYEKIKGHYLIRRHFPLHKNNLRDIILGVSTRPRYKELNSLSYTDLLLSSFLFF